MRKDTKKRVFIIDEHISSKQNGVGTYMRRLIDCIKTARLQSLALISYNAEVKHFSISKQYGVTHIEFPVIAQGDFIVKGGITLPVLRQYVEDVAENVFFVNHSPCADFLKMLREFFPKSKIVFTIHDQGWTAPLLGNVEYLKTIVGNRDNDRIHRIKLPKFITSDIKKFVRKYFKDEQRMYSTADAVICLSPTTLNLVEKVYGIPANKLHLIPNGIECQDEPTTKGDKSSTRRLLFLPDDEKIFLFVGRMVKAKGIEALLKAFEKISVDAPKVRLLIAGECHQANDVIKLVPSGCTRLVFMGLVSPEKMELLYRAADFGVLPSYTEQCSFTALEMMAHGLPVITSDGNGLTDMFTDKENAIVAKIEDFADDARFSENLFARMKYALTSPPEETRQIGTNGLAVIKAKYSMSLMAGRYSEFLNNLKEEKQ